MRLALTNETFRALQTLTIAQPWFGWDRDANLRHWVQKLTAKKLSGGMP